MPPRLSLSIGLLCILMLACNSVTATEGQPDLKNGYPEYVIPCLDAMQKLPRADGEKLRGVTDSDETCVISISFESQQSIDVFRQHRSAAGKSPDSMLHRLPDGTTQKIAFELQVGEGTVPP